MTRTVADLGGAGTKPPAVYAQLPQGKVNAVLIAWGRLATSPPRWAAGVANLHHTWHSRTLCTTWAPAVSVSPVDHLARGGAYRAVPRVALSGPPSAWPALPPLYPGATAEWIRAHQHYTDYRTAPA